MTSFNIAVERRLVRHERWISIALAWFSAAAVGIYTGVVSTGSGNVVGRVEAAGWSNLALAAGTLAVVTQLVLTVRAGASQERLRADENLALANRLLEATIKLLKLRKRGVNYRALITVYDSSTNTRITLGGANFRIDPESTLSVPPDFGIAGEAFVNNRCAYGNITDGERGRDSSGTHVATVWSEVRSVVAFPLAPHSGRRPTGTVNFDSDKYLSDAGLDGRDPLDALSDVAEVISRLLTRKNMKQ
jgi:hypothetical protein